MATNSPTLPPKMISEILSRASLKTLNTCRYVSKEWKHQIDELCATTKNNNDNHASGLFITQCSDDRYSDEQRNAYVSLNRSAPDTSSSNGTSIIPPDDMTILASSKGILFCGTTNAGGSNSTSRRRRYYVHKPTTKQWREVPKIGVGMHKVGMMVMGCNPLRFKIVTLAYMYHYFYDYTCCVFDSQSWEWRKIKHQELPPPSNFARSQCVSIASKSSFYWLTMVGKVVALHEPTGTIYTFSLPEPEFTYPNVLVEFEGRLGMILVNGNCYILELWLVQGDPFICNKNKEDVRWSKHLSVDIGRFVTYYPRHIFFSNCGIVLVDQNNGVVHYKIDSSFDRFELKDKGFANYFQFESDFEFEVGCFNNQGQIE